MKLSDYAGNIVLISWQNGITRTTIHSQYVIFSLFVLIHEQHAHEISVTVAKWYGLPLGTEQVVSSIPGSVGYISHVYTWSLRLIGFLRCSLDTHGLT